MQLRVQVFGSMMILSGPALATPRELEGTTTLLCTPQAQAQGLPEIKFSLSSATRLATETSLSSATHLPQTQTTVDLLRGGKQGLQRLPNLHHFRLLLAPT